MLCLIEYIAYGVPLCNKIYMFERSTDSRSKQSFRAPPTVGCFGKARDLTCFTHVVCYSPVGIRCANW